MTFDQIFDKLKKQEYAPIYFLMGDEPYFIDAITGYIMQNTLSEEEKTFNQTVLYGKDTTIATVINSAKRYPMMSKYQVVIVKEGQLIKDVDDLIHYAVKPLVSTILVFNYKYKKLAKNKKIYKELEKSGVVFESKKLYDNQVPDWINMYLSKKSIRIEPQASMLLTENIGNDLAKIANELDKLIIALPSDNKLITTSEIERNIGISKEYNNFELQNALSTRNVLKANRIINYFASNPNSNPLTVTIISLFSYYSKLLLYHFQPSKGNTKEVAAKLGINPFFIKEYQVAARNYDIRKTVQVIALLREYDMKSKGVNNVSTSHGDLLKELTYKILH